MGYDPATKPRAMTVKDGPGADPALGAYLKNARRALGLSLRAVEEKTGRQVTNGYLSQIESGAATRPSPNVLYHLAQVYGVDYGDLLVRAGHRVPKGRVPDDRVDVSGVPLRALEDLTADERDQLMEYLAFLKSRRAGPAGG